MRALAPARGRSRPGTTGRCGTTAATGRPPAPRRGRRTGPAGGPRSPRTAPPPGRRRAARPWPAARPRAGRHRGRRALPAGASSAAGAGQLPQRAWSTPLSPRPFELAPPRRPAGGRPARRRPGPGRAARSAHGGCGSRSRPRGRGGRAAPCTSGHPHLAQQVLVPLEVAPEGVSVVGVAPDPGPQLLAGQGADRRRAGRRPGSRVARAGPRPGAYRARPGSPAGSQRGDQLLHPLVPGLERVLAQHGPLGLVVELEVHPVDGEVAPALLGPRMNSPRSLARVVCGGSSTAVSMSSSVQMRSTRPRSCIR